MDSWLYVYCILEGTDLPSGSYRGLQGIPARAVAYRQISAAVSAVSRPRVPASGAHLLAHERLVEELMDRRTVLPVRFGTVLRDIASVRLELSRGYGSYLGGLDLVRGKVEMGVRVLAPEEPPLMEVQALTAPTPCGPGTRYLTERLRQHSRTRLAREQLDRLADSIDACLMHHAEARRLCPTSRERIALSAAYLVCRDKVPVFKGEVERQSRAHPELRFLLTGPWPAYSFVSGDARRIDPLTVTW